MPKIVDHAERRRTIVQATWRLIATQGIRATTMREIAREAGVANGTLVPYFTDKDAILTAAFEHVFAATNDRFARARSNQTGLAALRVMLIEIFPLDGERLLEARIVVAFWEHAATDPALNQLHQNTMARWRAEMLGYLEEAKREGQARSDLDTGLVADQLMAMLNGVQVLTVLSSDLGAAARLTAMLDDFLTRLN
ncbi:TetR/AcrR family transcriptional regulator [Leifsonia sp. YAF41]|uniref:TetR/AcrR family transcriptional regulator n=1 Tax=Leifsonia sp. YAF41 TaxID=3233086 RepID=UPI003F9A90D1